MGRDFTLGDLEGEGYRAVFLATGASKSRRLGVPGDDARGVVPATLFLKQVNLGEEPRLSGPAIVVGGGSTAMDAARSAWRSGASPVTIVYRRGRAEMPAQVEEIEAAEREGIVVQTGLAPVEVVSRDGAVVAMRCVETRATAGTTGPARAMGAGPRHERDLPAATILVAVGEEPDPSILPAGAGIEVSGWAGIVADSRTLATGRTGIFAGGDVVSGPKTIIDAVASGDGRPHRSMNILRASPMASASSSRPSATRRRPKVCSPSTCRRGHVPTRRCRWSNPARSPPIRSASTRTQRRRRRPGVSAATPSTTARSSTSGRTRTG